MSFETRFSNYYRLDDNNKVIPIVDDLDLGLDMFNALVHDKGWPYAHRVIAHYVGNSSYHIMYLKDNWQVYVNVSRLIHPTAIPKTVKTIY